MMTDNNFAEKIIAARNKYIEEIDAAKKHGLTVTILDDGEPIGEITLKISRVLL